MEGLLIYILTLDVSRDLWKHLITSLRRKLQHKLSRFFVFVDCGASVTIEAVSWDWALLNKSDWTTPVVSLSPLFLPLCLLTQSDYFPLAALPPSLLSSPSPSLRLSLSLYVFRSLFGLLVFALPAAAFCRAGPMRHSLLCPLSLSLSLSLSPSLLLSACPSLSPSPSLSPPSFLPTSLFPLIICYAALALQGSSHWYPFLSLPVLICYAAAIPLHTSHWSLSTELSITHTLTFLPLYPPPHVVWSHTIAVRDLFLPVACNGGVFHQRRLYTASEGCARPAASVLSIFPLRGNYLVSVTHAVGVLPFQSVISITWMHQRAY